MIIFLKEKQTKQRWNERKYQLRRIKYNIFFLEFTTNVCYLRKRGIKQNREVMRLKDWLMNT